MEIFLRLYAVFKKNSLIRCLHIALFKRNPFFLKDIGPKRQALNLMKAASSLCFPFGVCAVVTGPAFLLCCEMPLFVVNRQTIFIIYRTFFLINSLPILILIDLDRINQLLFSRFICNVSHDPFMIIVYKGHSCFCVCITDEIAPFI